MPELDLESLCTRMSQFHAEMRRAVRKGATSQTNKLRLHRAEQSLSEWFLEREITLTGLHDYMSR
jgi:hypothetical protein